MSRRRIAVLAALALAALAQSALGGTAKPFLSSLKSIRTVASTVPANGDVNPYGITIVPVSTGREHAGDILISNFNAKSNNQGTGTTIVQVSPSGQRTLFATLKRSSLHGSCPGGVGLTTALGLLPGGYVVVGSLPTSDGKTATAKAGCLIIVDAHGKPVGTIAGSMIQGPWDMATVSHGNRSTLFVSMILEGGAKAGRHVVRNSTVVRIELTSGPGQAPKVTGEQLVATGIPWRGDPSALVVGPTGLALARNGTLYLASTLENEIRAIPNAMTRSSPAAGGGRAISAGRHLKQPLGLELAPNGDILTTNGGDGNIVETTPAGKQVAALNADRKTGAGSLFGLVVSRSGRAVYYVDDGDNTLKELR